MLNVGDNVPDMLGIDEDGREIRISQFEGRKVVVYFYPKDNTPGCTAEACSFRDNLCELQSLGYAVVGVSADSAVSHKRFKEKHTLNFPLVTDPEHKLLETFGVWGEKKMAGRTYMGIIRTTFVVDANGIIERVIKKVDTKNAASQIIDNN
ncbi:MAG: thioredoxin-dependent thiol peroxidase [Bacteroidaceae bacterium]|nr:thioredoxin-dependent thiol peroxidase [Bacteroidaceae bacterium]